MRIVGDKVPVFFALDLSGSMVGTTPPIRLTLDWKRRNEMFKLLVECLDHQDSLACAMFLARMGECAEDPHDGDVRGRHELRLVHLLNASVAGRLCYGYDDFDSVKFMIDRYVERYGFPEGEEQLRTWEHRILSLYRPFALRRAPDFCLRQTLSRHCSVRSRDDVARRDELIVRMIAEAGFLKEEADEALETVLRRQSHLCAVLQD